MRCSFVTAARCSGDPRKGTTAWRRCRASGGSWLSEEEEDDAADLLDTLTGRGGGSTCGYGERRRRRLGDGGGESQGRAMETRGRSESGRGSYVSIHGIIQAIGEAG